MHIVQLILIIGVKKIGKLFTNTTEALSYLIRTWQNYSNLQSNTNIRTLCIVTHSAKYERESNIRHNSNVWAYTTAVVTRALSPVTRAIQIYETSKRFSANDRPSAAVSLLSDMLGYRGNTAPDVY